MNAPLDMVERGLLNVCDSESDHKDRASNVDVKKRTILMMMWVLIHNMVQRYTQGMTDP